MKTSSYLVLYFYLSFAVALFSCENYEPVPCDPSVYNDNKGTWIDLPNLIQATDPNYTLSAESENYILIGNLMKSGSSTEMCYYSKNDHSWHQVADFGPGPRKGCAVFAINDIFYFVGGQLVSNNNYLNTVYSYNPATNLWTSLGTYPDFARTNAFAEVVDGKAYIIGGSYQNGVVYSVLKYDPTLNSWTVNGNISTYFSNFTNTSCVFDDKIYLLNGSQIMCYDPISQTDSIFTLPLESGESLFNILYNDGSRMYFPVTNTYGAGCGGYDKVYVWNPVTRQWGMNKKYTKDDKFKIGLRSFYFNNQIYFADPQLRKFHVFLP